MSRLFLPVIPWGRHLLLMGAIGVIPLLLRFCLGPLSPLLLHEARRARRKKLAEAHVWSRLSSND